MRTGTHVIGLLLLSMVIFAGAMYEASSANRITRLERQSTEHRKEILRLSKLNAELSITLNDLVVDYYPNVFDQADLLTDPQVSGCLECHRG